MFKTLLVGRCVYGVVGVEKVSKTYLLSHEPCVVSLQMQVRWVCIRQRASDSTVTVWSVGVTLLMHTNH